MACKEKMNRYCSSCKDYWYCKEERRMSYELKRFVERIEEELSMEIPSDVFIEKAYAGYRQKSRSTFMFILRSMEDLNFLIGIFEPMRELVKCPRLVLSVRTGELCVEGMKSEAIC